MPASEDAVRTAPTLRRFRDEVEKLFPSRGEQVILYGSRARGDARPESDYGLAVVLRDYHSEWEDVERLADLQWDLLLETGYDVSALPFSAEEMRGSILASEIERDGIAL